MTQVELNTRLTGIQADFKAALKGLTIDAAAAVSTETGKPSLSFELSSGSSVAISGRSVLVNGQEPSWSDLLELVPILAKEPGVAGAVAKDVEEAAPVVEAVVPQWGQYVADMTTPAANPE